MGKEIERKYTIKYLPENIKIEKIIQIVQDLIYRDEITTIRLRKAIINKEEIKYIYTIKQKPEQLDEMLAQRFEKERYITKEQYEKLVKNKITNTIEKTRINIPIVGKLKAEVDIYYGYLDGLLTLEVEFENEEQAKNFKKPEWFGEELSYKEFSNTKLSKMTKEEFLSKFTKETIENNKKIINKLNIN